MPDKTRATRIGDWVVVWHRHRGRALGLERQWQIAAYISEGAKSLITSCLPLLSSPSCIHLLTNLPSSSPRHELFCGLSVEPTQFMYRSKVKLRTNIVGEPVRHIRPVIKPKYVCYIPFVDSVVSDH